MTKVELSFCNEIIAHYVKSFVGHYFSVHPFSEESPDEQAAKKVLRFIKDSDPYWYKVKTSVVLDCFDSYTVSFRNGFVKPNSIDSIIEVVLNGAYKIISRNPQREDGKSYVEYPPSFPLEYKSES